MTNIQHIKPKINFGNISRGYTMAEEGTVLTVWLSTLYNTEIFTIATDTDLTVTKISNYQYEITCDSLGFQNIQIFVENKLKLKRYYSNYLMVYVIPDLVIPTLCFNDSNNSQYLNIII